MKTALIKILLVEDSLEDIDLIEHAFKSSVLNPQLSVAKDGQEALDFLYKSGTYHNVELPDLIILDLNLPKKSGHQVLAQIKNDPQLKTIPVVILTTSRSPRDALKCYQNYANCYICKPLQFDEFIQVIKEIENFWFSVVQLPVTEERGSQ